MPEKPHIFDLTREQLVARVTDWGWPKFRADQVLQWVYERGVGDPQAMSNLSKRDRELLGERLRFETLGVAQHQRATDGTQKLLLEVDGGPSTTECVMIPAERRRTACLSSQIGCPVGCRFCASGLGGLERNLTAGQIVEQVWQLNRVVDFGSTEPNHITNVVFMGMGEPLTNFDNVVRAIRTLTAKWAFDLSGRRITVSTVGLPAQIRRLAEVDIPLTLAISLHAPNDALRRKLIPWAEHTTIDALVEAGHHYFKQTGREITLEYILLREVNDRVEHAEQLARIARRLRSHVNLIRYNEVRGLPFSRPASDDVRKFQQALRAAKVNVHIRASRGRDIAAACGQLRHEQAAGPRR